MLWNKGISWEEPIDLAYRISDRAAIPNCFGAHATRFEAFREGDFVGSIKAGAPLNFFRISMNPHGSTTHTECMGHIRDGYFLSDCVKKFLYNAYLVDAGLSKKNNGDFWVTPEHLTISWPEETEALIIRTPEIDVYKGSFTGKNPVYFSEETIRKINNTGIRHILVEWPSLDREEDGGKLAAHHAFWFVDGKWQKDKTITEMIRLPENIHPGKYVLNLQVLAIDLDVSPSRPILYPVKP